MHDLLTSHFDLQGRNDEFLQCLQDHGMVMFGGALVINVTPKPFRFIVGNLVSLVCSYYYRKAMKFSLPFVQERLDNTARLKADDSYPWTPPVFIHLPPPPTQNNTSQESLGT